MTINSRQKLGEYCLRQLGAPVVKINVDESQIDDCIDDGLQSYREYHYDGTLETYLKYQITAADLTNKYITVDNSSVIGIKEILTIPGTVPTSMWNVKYQIFLNEIYNFTSTSYTGYVITQQHLRNIEMLFTGKPNIRFNKNIGRLYIDQDWSEFTEGMYIIIVCFVVTDPEVYTKVYNDKWLKKYVTQLIKRQWGTNMKKFTNVQMLNGITMNGQQIYDEAQKEIDSLEAELESTYSYPVDFYVG